MPRNLADVLHHFLPELGASEASRDEPTPRNVGAGVEAGIPARRPGATRPATLLCVPFECDDLTRAALVWNLSVELARTGRRIRLVAPESPAPRARWAPAPGLEVDALEADDLPSLGARLEAGADVSIACVPPRWLDAAAQGETWLRGVLLLVRPGEANRVAAYERLASVARNLPGAQLGVSIHGASSLAQAERTFLHLAEASEEHLGRTLASYGVLVEDLDLCRSIVTGRPLALTRPRSRAARALRDVARLLLEDAEATLG